jgi:hypothetical protein
MAVYRWSVFVPGADLPALIETDYLLAEGDEIHVAGRAWIVARVELADDPEEDVMQASVVVPSEPF